jgi:hypothetical protein
MPTLSAVSSGRGVAFSALQMQKGVIIQRFKHFTISLVLICVRSDALQKKCEQ